MPTMSIVRDKYEANLSRVTKTQLIAQRPKTKIHQSRLFITPERERKGLITIDPSYHRSGSYCTVSAEHIQLTQVDEKLRIGLEIEHRYEFTLRCRRVIIDVSSPDNCSHGDRRTNSGFAYSFCSIPL
jgi:hypothetical protein